MPPSTTTLDGKAAHSNNFLRCPRRRARHDAARDAGKIALAAINRQSARSQYRRDGWCLARSDLARKHSSRSQQPEELEHEGPISAETVSAAVEGQTGVVEGDLGGQIGECRAADIRRVRSDYIEPA